MACNTFEVLLVCLAALGLSLVTFTNSSGSQLRQDVRTVQSADEQGPPAAVAPTPSALCTDLNIVGMRGRIGAAHLDLCNAPESLRMLALTLMMYATVRNVTVPAVISCHREVLRSVTLKYRPTWSTHSRRHSQMLATSHW
jgi:hypothetical protein